MVLPDRRMHFCDEHRVPGEARRKAARNRRYNDGQHALVAAARTPEVGGDRSVRIPRPLVDELAAPVARLDGAVTEYDRSRKSLIEIHMGLFMKLEGWDELRAETEHQLRLAITELRHAARDACSALGPVLDPGRRPDQGRG